MCLIFFTDVLLADTILQKKHNKIIKKYYMEGMNYYLQYDFKNALKLWKKVVKIEPSHKKAKIYFKKAFKKNKDIKLSLNNGKNSFNQKKYLEALSHFKKIFFINPKHKKALNYLNKCYKKLQIKIKIVDSPSKKGRDINNLTLTTDDEITLYAIGFDKFNNYLGLIEVLWESTGTLEPLNPSERVNKIRFTPKKHNTKGTIIASIDENIKQEISKVRIKSGKLNHIRIVNAPNLMGDKVKKINTTTDQKEILYTAGFDKDNIYIGEVPARWKSTGTIENINSEESSMFLFQSKKAGYGKIMAVARNNTMDVISNVIVHPGKLAYIQIEDAPAGDGKELYSFNMSAGDKKFFYSIGYDAYDNVIGNINADFKTTGTLEKYNVYDNIKFIYPSKISGVYGTIKAGKENVVGDETGLIKVLSGRVDLKVAKISLMNFSNNIIVSNIVLNYNEQVKLRTVGLNKDNEYVNNIEVYWLIPEKENILKYDYGAANILKGIQEKFEGVLILTAPSEEIIKVATIKIFPSKVEALKKFQKVKSENILIHYIRNGDILCKVVADLLNLPYKWKILYKYINAIGEYNKIKNLNLIFPNQKIKVPYYKVEKKTTKKELAKKIFDDKNKENQIIIYQGKGNVILPKDKLILLDEEFLSKGNLSIDLSNLKGGN